MFQRKTTYSFVKTTFGFDCKTQFVAIKIKMERTPEDLLVSNQNLCGIFQRCSKVSFEGVSHVVGNKHGSQSVSGTFSSQLLNCFT